MESSDKGIYDVPDSKFALQLLEQAHIAELVTCLRLKGDLFRYLCDYNTGFYLKETRG